MFSKAETWLLFEASAAHNTNCSDVFPMSKSMALNIYGS